MKKYISLFVVFLSAALSQAQQVITSTVTLTNLASITNATMAVNGHVRTWVTSRTSGSTQILIGANTNACATNMMVAYGGFPETHITVSFASSNALTMQSDPGYALVIALSANYGFVSSNAVTYGTRTPILMPMASVGVTDRTNAENAIVDYLNSNTGANVIATNAHAFSNFPMVNEGDLAVIGANATNFSLQIGRDCTNFTLGVGQNASNYIFDVGTYASNAINSLGTAAYKPVEAFQPACGLLSNLCSLGTLQGLSYIEAGTGNILLSNTNSIERIRADKNGAMDLKFEEGTVFLEADTSHNVMIKDLAGTARFETANTAGTTIRSATTHDGIVLDGVSDMVTTYAPIAFNNAIMRSIAIGTLTNYYTSAQNSGAGSDTTVHTYALTTGTLAEDGDMVVRSIGVSLATGTSSKRVQVYYAGNSIFDSGGLTTSGAGSLSIVCEIMRSGADSIRYNSKATGTLVSTTAFAHVGEMTGVTIDSTFYIVLTASGGDATSGQISVITDHSTLELSPSWQ